MNIILKALGTFYNAYENQCACCTWLVGIYDLKYKKKPSVLQNVERSKLEIFLNPKLFYQKEKKKNGYEN